MLKVNCSNSGCGEIYYFNDERFPNATKVKCPKCGQLQPRPNESKAVAKEESDDDWFKPKEKPLAASPQLNYDTPVQKPFIEAPVPDVEEENFFAPPKSAAPVYKEQQRSLPPPTPAVPRANILTDAIGWLVIHDEYTESRTFALRKGINRIGRASDSTPKDVNICIETKDTYMSRHHCDIEVRQKSSVGGYEYILSDRDYGGKKASANGTFLNAQKRLSTMDEPVLQDNDTVQVGRTKLVLKLPSAVQNAQEAEHQVRQTDFFHTIIS